MWLGIHTVGNMVCTLCLETHSGLRCQLLGLKYAVWLETCCTAWNTPCGLFQTCTVQLGSANTFWSIIQGQWQNSAVKVHDSQAYRKMAVTKAHILELTEMLLLFQTGFNLVNAAVVCAFLESISGLEPLSDNWAQVLWSLWLSQGSVCLFWFPCWCHWCCLSPTWSSQHWYPCHWLWRFCWDAQLNLPVLFFLSC